MKHSKMALSELYFKILSIFTCLCICFTSDAQQIPIEIEQYHETDILKITEFYKKSTSVKVYEGAFLKKETFYLKKHIWSESNYYYEISDDKWVVFGTNTLKKDTSIVSIFFKQNICSAINYNYSKNNKKVISICNRLVTIPNDTSICKVHYYCHNDTICKEVFINDTLSSIKKTLYNKNVIVFESTEIVNDPLAIICDVVCWSKKQQNKYIILYDNFDKKGNWTKSYYLTETGKVLRSKRSIVYNSDKTKL